jgi:4-hydroxy-3-methylbut-2-enyl diphosphate reductase
MKVNNMIIKIAEKAGFCFGVKRAVDMAVDFTAMNDKLYSYGQLIHNDQVTEKLESDGLIIVDDLSNLENQPVLIRSHGVGKEVYELESKQSLELVDCTCPFVKKVHRIVDEHYNKGYRIIIIGNKDHPEIIGINGWCENEGIIISTPAELPTLEEGNYCVVAQTTLKIDIWTSVLERLGQSKGHFEFFNTICSATSERQEAVRKLAPTVDLMIVIGGFHSSNTRKLYEICKELCQESIHVEKKSELVMTNLKKYDIIGITAGASTPNWVIQEIIDFLKDLQ